MEEADVNSVSVEVAPSDANQAPQNTPAPDDSQERNWRAARQRMAELERERDREKQEKEELIKRVLDSQSVKKEEPEEPDDEFINKASVKKVARKTIEPLEKELQELKSQLAFQKQQGMITSLRNKYSDFDDIVNPETIALFEEKEPELASQIAEIKDPYKIGVQSYKFIKASGIISDLPDKRRQKETEKMLDKNSKTVQSPQAFDKRPMAQAFRLTEHEKSKLYEEMMGYASQASSIPNL